MNSHDHGGLNGVLREGSFTNESGMDQKVCIRKRAKGVDVPYAESQRSDMNASDCASAYLLDVYGVVVWEICSRFHE